MNERISGRELVDLLALINQAQQDHMMLIRTNAPCRVEPHTEDATDCPSCQPHMVLYRSIGRVRLWAIRFLEGRELLPVGSIEKEELRQAGIDLPGDPA